MVKADDIMHGVRIYFTPKILRKYTGCDRWICGKALIGEFPTRCPFLIYQEYEKLAEAKNYMPPHIYQQASGSRMIVNIFVEEIWHEGEERAYASHFAPVIMHNLHTGPAQHIFNEIKSLIDRCNHTVVERQVIPPVPQKSPAPEIQTNHSEIIKFIAVQTTTILRAMQSNRNQEKDSADISRLEELADKLEAAVIKPSPDANHKIDNLAPDENIDRVTAIIKSLSRRNAATRANLNLILEKIHKLKNTFPFPAECQVNARKKVATNAPERPLSRPALINRARAATKSEVAFSEVLEELNIKFAQNFSIEQIQRILKIDIISQAAAEIYEDNRTASRRAVIELIRKFSQEKMMYYIERFAPMSFKL